MTDVTELTEERFEDFTREGLVLVDFFANWCMPCIAMEPVISGLAEKFDGKIKFGKVNIDENRGLSEKFGVRSIPSFFMFDGGEMKEQFIGSMPAEVFENKLKKFLTE